GVPSQYPPTSHTATTPTAAADRSPAARDPPRAPSPWHRAAPDRGSSRTPKRCAPGDPLPAAPPGPPCPNATGCDPADPLALRPCHSSAPPLCSRRRRNHILHNPGILPKSSQPRSPESIITGDGGIEPIPSPSASMDPGFRRDDNEVGDTMYLT